MKCGHIYHVWNEVNMENDNVFYNSYMTKDELI